MEINYITEYASSVYSAILKDLPDIEYESRLPGQTEKEIKKRRPFVRELDIYSFPQVWGSTALGFGGMGGQKMTSALTVIVVCGICSAVYFGGRLAYLIQNPNPKFFEDIANHRMESCSNKSKYHRVEYEKGEE